MSTKFTPGPWTEDISRSCVVGPLGVTVAHCGQAMTSCADGSYWIRAEESSANAHLIAAAPELYAALQACCEEAFDTETTTARMVEIRRTARAALAKARGES